VPEHEASARGPVRSDERREPYVDFLRAFSLLVVVVWHWAFTIIIWQDDGPRATNPISFTNGLWLATWLLQVPPVFFYVGRYGHLKSWEKARERSVPLAEFVLVLLGGTALTIDVLRFRKGRSGLAWLNMVIVWGLCQQLGFFYERIVRAARTVSRRLRERERWSSFSEVINRFAMPLFLLHTTGMAPHRGASYAIAGQVNDAGDLPVRSPLGEAAGPGQK
jgi:hypothetical protein